MEQQSGGIAATAMKNLYALSGSVYNHIGENSPRSPRRLLLFLIDIAIEERLNFIIKLEYLKVMIAYCSNYRGTMKVGCFSSVLPFTFVFNKAGRKKQSIEHWITYNIRTIIRLYLCILNLIIEILQVTE